MIEDNSSEWQKIEQEIYAAFRDVKLEDGIGYYEAGALDEYLQRDDEKYMLEKAKDERDDWTILLSEIPESGFAGDRYCFMDAKGLRFFLPFLLIRKSPAINNILHSYISEICSRRGYLKSCFTDTVRLLTKEQKMCIYHFYDYLSKIKNSDFYEEYLNSDFDTGEDAMKGFNFMDFISKHLGPG